MDTHVWNNFQFLPDRSPLFPLKALENSLNSTISAKVSNHEDSNEIQTEEFENQTAASVALLHESNQIHGESNEAANSARSPQSLITTGFEMSLMESNAPVAFHIFNEQPEIEPDSYIQNFKIVLPQLLQNFKFLKIFFILFLTILSDHSNPLRF